MKIAELVENAQVTRFGKLRKERRDRLRVYVDASRKQRPLDDVLKREIMPYVNYTGLSKIIALCGMLTGTIERHRDKWTAAHTSAIIKTLALQAAEWQRISAGEEDDELSNLGHAVTYVPEFSAIVARGFGGLVAQADAEDFDPEQFDTALILDPDGVEKCEKLGYTLSSVVELICSMALIWRSLGEPSFPTAILPPEPTSEPKPPAEVFDEKPEPGNQPAA